MTHAFRNRSRTHQVLLLPAGVPVLALLVVEGLNTRFLPTTIAAVVTGAACVTALVVPPARFPLAVGCAVVASLALSVADVQLPQNHRPENTPGLMELCALLLLIARTVRLRSLPGIAALVPATSAAAGLLLLRIPESEYDHVKTLGVPVLLVFIVLMVVLGLYLRLVDTVRVRERRTAEQTARQAERLEQARELHDFVAHHVTAIVAQAKAARYVTSAGRAPSPDDLDQVLAGIEEAGSQAMDSMRSMVSVLRTPEDAAGTRPGGDLTRVRDLVETFSAAGRPVRLSLDPRLTEQPLPPETSTTVHRVVQESLTNVRKYADADAQVTVDIRLRSADPGWMDVSVTDNGKSLQARPHRTRSAGPSRPTRSRQQGYGLIGLAERVEALGGRFTAGPLTGSPGWNVAAAIPLPMNRP
ncbi:sensor histidine kinase [Streptomyces sp. NPDC002499]